MYTRWGIACLAVLALVATVIVIRARDVSSSYAELQADAHHLDAIANRHLQDLSDDDLRQTKHHLESLHDNIRQLENVTAIPLVEGSVHHIPWAGQRYEAHRDALHFARLVTSAALLLFETLLDIRSDPTLALTSCGKQNDAYMTLVLLSERQRDMDRIANLVLRARTIQQGTEEAVLTNEAQRYFQQVLPILERLENLVNANRTAQELDGRSPSPVHCE